VGRDDEGERKGEGEGEKEGEGEGEGEGEIPEGPLVSARAMSSIWRSTRSCPICRNRVSSLGDYVRSVQLLGNHIR
jgi:hypothetical protein